MAITRPVGEQLHFSSAATGLHILDDYLEAAEAGGRTLADLIGELFDSSGVLSAFEFRMNGDVLEYRVGTEPWQQLQSFADLIQEVKDWANKTGATVDGVEYSAKHYAGVADTHSQDAETARDAAQTAQTGAEAAETSAQSHASDALTYRDAAQTAKTDAENILDQFDDRYLGAFASDPTTDNDGDALQVGAMYFNTTAPETRAWNGSNWQALSTVVGVSSVAGKTGDVTLDTDDVSEGTGNLYHTAARASAAAPVQSVNGQTGDVTVVSGVTSVNGQTGAVTGMLEDSDLLSQGGTVADTGSSPTFNYLTTNYDIDGRYVQGTQQLILGSDANFGGGFRARTYSDGFRIEPKLRGSTNWNTSDYLEFDYLYRDGAQGFQYYPTWQFRSEIRSLNSDIPSGDTVLNKNMGDSLYASQAAIPTFQFDATVEGNVSLRDALYILGDGTVTRAVEEDFNFNRDGESTIYNIPPSSATRNWKVYHLFDNIYVFFYYGGDWYCRLAAIRDGGITFYDEAPVNVVNSDTSRDVENVYVRRTATGATVYFYSNSNNSPVIHHGYIDQSNMTMGFGNTPITFSQGRDVHPFVDEHNDKLIVIDHQGGNLDQGYIDVYDFGNLTTPVASEYYNFIDDYAPQFALDPVNNKFILYRGQVIYTFNYDGSSISYDAYYTYSNNSQSIADIFWIEQEGVFYVVDSGDDVSEMSYSTGYNFQYNIDSLNLYYRNGQKTYDGIVSVSSYSNEVDYVRINTSTSTGYTNMEYTKIFDGGTTSTYGQHIAFDNDSKNGIITIRTYVNGQQEDVIASCYGYWTKERNTEVTGIADAAGTNGDTVTVKVSKPIQGGYTNLLPGRTYYQVLGYNNNLTNLVPIELNDNGSKRHPVGKAVSSTHLMLEM